ncbi:NADP-dependent oxidoreductase [Aeromicrobium sp. Root495]|uniref:NADP-dependent oxidoreductase n=1 Tax=Aeromicrobium sp. Root495 TaxID=1736550 RepID=UPI0006FE4453|nr:NADP-dependent oxidoreductase [Aeromicrobium sp. Root495]KQY58452.1 NADP-dependent oxidoreductase [Aeromicrobium sp. Root495]
MTVTARRVHLAQRPVGLPDASTWSVRETRLDAPGEGEVLVKVTHLSLDPAMRGWLNDVKSYVPPVGVDEVMRAGGVGEVLESRDPRFSVGDPVSGMLGIADHAVVKADELTPIDLSVAGPATWLGALGMPGMTAWFGLFDVARLQDGDTVLVSGAAGAVGSVVGQLAKARGCTVVGIAGGPEKTAWLTDELGFDAAIDYRQGDLNRAIKEAAPKGVDVYFDNVGGETLDAALRNLRRGARIAICGAISTYNATEPVPGPANYMSLLVNRASMTGFLVFDYADRYGEAVEGMGAMIADGSLVAREHVVEGGVDAFPDTLLMLFSGANTGKLVLTV